MKYITQFREKITYDSLCHFLLYFVGSRIEGHQFIALIRLGSEI